MAKLIKTMVIIAIIAVVGGIALNWNGRVIDQFTIDDTNITVREVSPYVYDIQYTIEDDLEENVMEFERGNYPILSADGKISYHATICVAEGYDVIKDDVRANRYTTSIE